MTSTISKVQTDMTFSERKQLARDRILCEREAQRVAFQKTLEGRATSSYTDAEYAEAKRLHLSLQTWETGCKGWDGALRLQLPGMAKHGR